MLIGHCEMDELGFLSCGSLSLRPVFALASGMIILVVKRHRPLPSPGIPRLCVPILFRTHNGDER